MAGCIASTRMAGADPAGTGAVTPSVVATVTAAPMAGRASITGTADAVPSILVDTAALAPDVTGADLAAPAGIATARGAAVLMPAVTVEGMEGRTVVVAVMAEAMKVAAITADRDKCDDEVAPSYDR